MTAPTVKGRTRFITLADLDGRSRAARNARDIAAAMTADLGGEQDLTEAQRQLIQRAATLGALIEDFETRFLAGEQLDALPKYLSAITTQRHVLSLLGLERRAHDATPDIQNVSRRHAGQSQERVVNILDALDHPQLFKKWFDAPTWDAWRAFLAALFALPMSEQQLGIYRDCTKRTAAPSKAFNEAWLVCGRRAGKSSILALTAVFLACFKDYKPHLAPGEVATIRVMAADRAQARTIFRYVGALLRETPLLQKLITRETADTFELSNRVAIEIGTASFRSARGYTFAAVLADEIAFWYDENSANPDEEVLVALRPGLITIPGAMLLCASSPYARKGALWQAFERWHGQDDAPALIWHASTRTMNPSVPEEFIAR